jgi:hypothetical protein
MVHSSSKGSLKKQGQFVPNLMGVTLFIKGAYDNNPLSGVNENKADQTCPESAERSQSQA